MKGKSMSHLSQLVSEALANARVGDGVKMHQAGQDRVQLTVDGQPCYVVCFTEHEMDSIHRHLPYEVEYRDKFAV